MLSACSKTNVRASQISPTKKLYFGQSRQHKAANGVIKYRLVSVNSQYHKYNSCLLPEACRRFSFVLLKKFKLAAFTIRFFAPSALSIVFKMPPWRKSVINGDTKKQSVALDTNLIVNRCDVLKMRNSISNNDSFGRSRFYPSDLGKRSLLLFRGEECCIWRRRPFFAKSFLIELGQVS